MPCGCGSKPIGSHFGVGAPPISVHWGYDLDFDPWPRRFPFFGSHGHAPGRAGAALEALRCLRATRRTAGGRLRVPTRRRFEAEAEATWAKAKRDLTFGLCLLASFLAPKGERSPTLSGFSKKH